MCSPSTPPAPDYIGAANATAAGNLSALQYQTQANRVNQNTPTGSQSWTQGTGANAGTWTENTTLTPQEQAAETSQQNIQQAQSGLAENMQGNVANTMGTPFQAPSVSSYMGGVPQTNTGYGGFNGGGVPGVNTNAPQFNQATANAGAQSAFNAGMGFLAPQEAQQTQSTQDQLSLQGLTPGTEAYDNAAKNVQSGQAQENTALANQSVQTGNQEANQNYSSQLAGYNAGNAAQNQSYGQALGTYGTGQQAITSANQAQNQEYGQALTGYQTAYGAAQNAYNEPLNAMNAVETGQQVQPSSFPNYSQEGYAGGANISGATQNQAGYNQGIYNSQAAQSSSQTNAAIGLAGTAAMAFAMY